MTQAEKAKLFLELHKKNKLLVLPNIWNPIGARLLQKKGFKAAATASASISASLGYQDGEFIKLSTLIDILSRITSSVDIPVSADIETGYASDLNELKNSVSAIIDSDVAGINIEDGMGKGIPLRNLDEQCERISLIRELSDKKGIHLVINARTDTFLGQVFNSKEEQIDETIKRAKAFEKAGADCFYPVGPVDLESIKILRKNIKLPINILASKNISLKQLQEAGVNRVSFGPFIFRYLLRKYENIIDEISDYENRDGLSENIFIPADEISKYLLEKKE